MLLLKLVFFIGIFIIFYSYIGYGILVWILVKIKKRFSKPTTIPADFYPPVTLIIAAYNEENFIEEKIRNTLEISYPEEQLRIIFITDGSSDNTPAIVQRYPRINLFHENLRAGKVAAMHRAMSHVTTPYVVFSDANTLLNRDSIRNIVQHYQFPDVGGVAGEKKIIASPNDSIAGAGEGLYWKYESFLKKLDSDFYSVVGAAGELFSVRTELYAHPGNNILLDDLIISLQICRKGYRIVYEPQAYAMETPSTSIKEEQKRKIRISAGAFQSIILLKDLLNIFKYPKLSFQYISHRVLRWTLCPLFLPIILLTNIALVIAGAGTLYTILLAGQVLFYLGAVISWLFMRETKKGFLYALYYFLFINYSLYLGFFRFLKGNQTVLWEKAARQEYNAPAPH